jgi:hypothetical protein
VISLNHWICLVGCFTQVDKHFLSSFSEFCYQVWLVAKSVKKWLKQTSKTWRKTGKPEFKSKFRPISAGITNNKGLWRCSERGRKKSPHKNFNTNHKSIKRPRVYKCSSSIIPIIPICGFSALQPLPKLFASTCSLLK